MIIVKLKSVLIERNITQKELAEMTKLRRATISEISRGQRGSINIEHLEKIAIALKITKISDLIDFY